MAFNEKQLGELDLAYQREQAGTMGGATTGANANAGDAANLAYARSKGWTPKSATTTPAATSNIETIVPEAKVEFKPAETKTQSESNYGATPVVGGSQTVRDTLTDTEKQLADLESQSYNAMSSLNTTTSDEEARIAAAGEAEYKNWQSTISNAEKEKALGMGKTTIGAGESGGFLNTQMAGRAALTGRYGEFAGGEIDRVKSAYDSNIDNLIAQRAAAVSQAKEMMRKAIRGEKLEGFQSLTTMLNYARQKSADINAAQQAKADSLQKMQQWALDYQQEERKNQLEIDKFIAGQADNDTKNKIAEGRLNLDYMEAAGILADGTQTLEAKKAAAENMYKQLGLEFNERKFLADNDHNKVMESIAQGKLDLDISKEALANSGVDVNQLVADKMNGGIGMEKTEPGYQAYRAKLNAVTNMLKNEGNTTKNPYFTIKASATNKDGLTATSQDNVAKMFGVMPNLEGVKTLYDEMNKKGKIGVLTGWVNNQNFTDPEAVEFKSRLAGLIPLVARGVFGEVGVLTDNDMATYAKAVLDMGQPAKAGENIYSSLVNTINSRIESNLVSAANNGKNVSGYADDYLNMASQLNKYSGKTFTPSVNEAAFDHWDQFSAQLGPQMTAEWINNHSQMMADAGIGVDKLEDYYQYIKEQKLMSDIYKDIEANSNSGASPSGVIQSNFNKVGTDTNKGTSSLGKLSEKYESGGNPGAIGYDSTGGYSYGKYQLAHSNADKFVKQSPYAKEFKGLTFNSPQWQNKWKEVAQKDPDGFGSSQKAYIEQNWYIPQLNKIANSGIDVNKLSEPVRDVIWSTAVQHGGNTDIITRAYNEVKRITGAEPTDADLITQIYNERWSGGKRFASSTPQVQASVKNRFKKELSDALAMLNKNNLS